MDKLSRDEAKDKAQLISELTKVVGMQLSGEMDFVRARAYWESRLPDLPLEFLAEALSYAITAESRYRRGNMQRF
jgi:phosphoserine phosphatase